MSAPAGAPPTAELEAQMAELTVRVHELKTSKQPFQAEQKQLGELKRAMNVAVGGGGKKEAAGKARLTLKTPKGTKDHGPSATLMRKQIFSTLESIFLKHGACTIDTPVFELRDILAGKYGEDSKLIYDLQDQGGELCSLRYDLTVPFARFLAMNQSTYPSIKRYHIGKVYRRDQPAMSKGRMREFYQCVRVFPVVSRDRTDFDIAGNFDTMVPDSEILCILVEALTALDIGEFTVKLNHRKILDGIFELAGVPADKIRSISSAVDKLDKSPWEEVRREMTVDKGLDGTIADRIGEYVKFKGPGKELLATLQADEKLMAVPSANQGLKEMAILFDYLEIFGVLGYMSFDMSLARGLDYYTGIIYEAVHASSAPPGIATQPAVGSDAAATAAAVVVPAGEVKKSKKKPADEGADADEEVDESQVGVGSIAAGGRYDELVGMFYEASGGKKGGGKIPCVGISVGVERVYSIMLAQRKAREEREGRGKETQVFVVAVGGDGLLKERMALVKQLWDAGIKAEFAYKAKPKLQQQFDTCDRDQTPLTVIIGPKELEQGLVRVRRQVGKEGGAGEGEPVEQDRLIEYLQAQIAQL
ncbi:hypothetical protein QFC19_008441 [Naganishia cerealis]|uniref:Uncharacterized protein n=1 Tax=Naganishia cerealis TaxID=610337 RepID=A0ACC2V1L3_9TREE|nr:hypothetical protein QFC19_008441 [Naganishia cerealis]